MEQKRKTLLIVDDTKIDRITLKSILCRDFDVLEAESGSIACQHIAQRGSELDAILLDISMPEMDGFGVLEFIVEKQLEHIPVFLVTAEPTVDNLQRAMHYNIAEFIGKPFQRDDVLRRLHSWLYITVEPNLTPQELEETWAYIAELEELYRTYLLNHGQSDVRCRILADLTRILLTAYNRGQHERRLSETGIELVCKAAYFCDIGEMAIPCQWLQPMVGEARYKELRRAHPLLGAKLIRLNRSQSCQYFVNLCADMCLHHHERYDGKGWPDKLRENGNAVCNQICRLADEFERLRNGAYDEKGQAVALVVRRLAEKGGGLVNPALLSLLKGCEQQIVDYYKKIYQGV